MIRLPQSTLIAPPRFLFLCFFIFVFPHVEAAQLYRYKDNSGKVVLSRTIPPELVGNGYEILNEKGRVVESIPPALTPEQIQARDAELERQRLLAEEKARQAEKDAELKQLYSHPDDAVRILERKAQDILSLMEAKRSQIEFSAKNIVDIEQKAAELQRKGIKVPDRYNDQLKALKLEIENSELDIQERSQSFDDLLAEFDTIVQRLEVITRKKANDYEAKVISLKERKLAI